jgi:hypothetical protein
VTRAGSRDSDPPLESIDIGLKNAGRRGFARSWLPSAIRQFSHDPRVFRRNSRAFTHFRPLKTRFGRPESGLN